MVLDMSVKHIRLYIGAFPLFPQNFIYETWRPLLYYIFHANELIHRATLHSFIANFYSVIEAVRIRTLRGMSHMEKFNSIKIQYRYPRSAPHYASIRAKLWIIYHRIQPNLPIVCEWTRNSKIFFLLLNFQKFPINLHEMWWTSSSFKHVIQRGKSAHTFSHFITLYLSMRWL